MAEWTQILDEDDATIDFGGVEIDVYSLARGWKYHTQFKYSTHYRAATKVDAQRAALDALITQLDAWKAQAEAARVALDEVVLND